MKFITDRRDISSTMALLSGRSRGNPAIPPSTRAAVTVAEKYLLTGVEHDTKCEGDCLRPSVLLPVCRRLALCSGSHYSVCFADTLRCGGRRAFTPRATSALACKTGNGHGSTENILLSPTYMSRSTPFFRAPPSWDELWPRRCSARIEILTTWVASLEGGGVLLTCWTGYWMLALTQHWCFIFCFTGQRLIWASSNVWMQSSRRPATGLNQISTLSRQTVSDICSLFRWLNTAFLYNWSRRRRKRADAFSFGITTWSGFAVRTWWN